MQGLASPSLIPTLLGGADNLDLGWYNLAIEIRKRLALAGELELMMSRFVFRRGDYNYVQLHGLFLATVARPSGAKSYNRICIAD
jgi:hypothetical protein